VRGNCKSLATAWGALCTYLSCISLYSSAGKEQLWKYTKKTRYATCQSFKDAKDLINVSFTANLYTRGRGGDSLLKTKR
jgi:hypothetical protein